MDFVDRSAIPALHAAARRHRSVYVGCLFSNLRNWLARLAHPRVNIRHAPCG